MVDEFCKRLFNATFCREFLVCFTIAKYENDTLSICETTNMFIGAFYYFKIPFHQLDGSFEYPQHIFWLRNKKVIFLLRTLIKVLSL